MAKQPWEQTVYDVGMFRGVPFLYQEVKGTVGRRTILTEYPGKEAKPRVEDLGPASGIFTMELFVMGPDYDVERDALRAAFNEPGPGELVHPYWGTMDVTVHGPVNVVETTRRGGMATFTATFVQDGAKLELLEERATDVTVFGVTEQVITVAESEFAALFTVAAAIASTVDAAVEAVQAVSSAISNIKGKIAAAMQVVNEATAAINSVVDGVVDLINTPAALAGALTAAVRSVVTGVTSIGAAFEEAIDFFDGEETLPAEGNVIAARTRVSTLMNAIADIALIPDSLPALPTSSAQQQLIKAQNQKALDRLMKANTIAVVSQIAVELDYESYDQAQDMRGAITELIDVLLLDDDLSDDMYAPLCNLRASLAEHFTAVASSLPELRDYTPVQTIPALVLAYQIYGDSKREVEILARNPTLRDQTAVPGGVAIKVLIDE